MPAGAGTLAAIERGAPSNTTAVLDGFALLARETRDVGSDQLMMMMMRDGQMAQSDDTSILRIRISALSHCYLLLHWDVNE